MVLYIVTPNRNRYKKNIEILCKKVGINDFVILDPEHDDCGKPLPAVVVMGPPNGHDTSSPFMWRTDVPDSTLPPQKKKAILAIFKKIAVDLREIRLSFKKDDVQIENLDDFMNKYKGQVFEVSLADGRYVGVYPDKEKLKGIYPIEYHVSELVNMNRIISIFNPEEVIIKET